MGMVPGTIFEIIDQSMTEPVYKEISTPLFCCVFSSDKGPEDFRITQGKQFYKLFGENIQFNKHGQPLLQAANVIENGGVVLGKRVVAPDSTLANIAVIAKIKTESIAKTTKEGKPLYVDSISGKETETVGTNKQATSSKCKISFELKSMSKIKNKEAIVKEIGNLQNDKGNKGEYVYPLFILTDIGRGDSDKKIRIIPDYEACRHVPYVKYDLCVIEHDKVVERIPFSFEPNAIERDVNISLESMVNFNSNQLRCKAFESNMILYMKKLAELTNTPLEKIVNSDVLFGCDKTNNPLENIELVEDKDNPVNLSTVYGINLENGSSGSFGDTPITSEALVDAMVDVFNGSFDDNIYSYDVFKPDVIIDANYDDKVKRTIEEYVTFREDISYFRDMGTNVRNINDILAKLNNMKKNKFCDTYSIAYDIIDPFTKKQIPVTVGYSLSRLLINHFKNGRNRPLAGQLYDMTIPEAIEGTINFIPKVTPNINEKEILVKNRVNYGAYYNNVLTIETLYTSQEINSQFSYINNILAVQEIIKGVREKCPKIRYSFISGKDLETYKKEVQKELDKYSGNFEELTMTYVQDPTMVANKVFYASIRVKFKDFAQTEYFKLYAIN